MYLYLPVGKSDAQRSLDMTVAGQRQCGSQCQNDEDSQNNAHLSDDEDEDIV